MSIVLIMASSCTRQELNDNQGGGLQDGVRINFSLPVSTVVETRSGKTPDESQLNSMHVLVFEYVDYSATKLVEVCKAITIDNGISIVQLSSSKGKPRAVRIIANADAIIEQATKK